MAYKLLDMAHAVTDDSKARILYRSCVRASSDGFQREVSQKDAGESSMIMTG
jgi:hypothetical protein